MKIKEFILVGFLLLLVFIASLSIPTDPDLGWQLKYGESVIEKGQILRSNSFSSMMPNYEWVNHSWGTDAIMYILFDRLGFAGLTMAGSLVVVLTIFLFTKAARISILNRIILTPIVLYLVFPLNEGSFRPQIVSLALLGVLSYLLQEYDQKKGWKIFFVIPLFFIWANLHGQFILGLGVYLLWTLLRILRSYIEEENWQEIVSKGLILLCAVFIPACLVVLINPFGVGVYTEALRHFFSPNLKYIVEWHPLPVFSLLWWQLIVMGGVLVWSGLRIKSAQKFKEYLPIIGIVSILFIFSLFARRYVWPFYYLSIPLLGFLVASYIPHIKKSFVISIVGLSIFAVVVLVVKLPINKYFTYSWDDFCKIRLCSSQVVDVLIEKNLHTDPNLMTQYDLGGWLIWNYPDVKPAIDGRMTLWEDPSGYSAFGEYILLENNIEDIDKSRFNVALVSIGKPMTKHLARLSIDGKWDLVYGDDNSAIFIRKNLEVK